MSETVLSYWREDPLFNEHHEHWHLVYPYAGKIDRKLHTEEELEALEVANGDVLARYLLWNDRHGELFAYMHAQILARYAAERLSNNLPPVIPFDDYRQPIAESYIPGLSVQLRDKVWVAGARPANTELKDIQSSRFRARPGAQISSQERFRDRLLQAVASLLENNRPLTICELAERIEATDRFETPYFGALHNDGHILISMHDDNPDSPGCMFWEATAVRDPVFYRWHAHVDSLFRTYQNTLVPYDFADLPAVELSKLTIVAASGTENELITELRTRHLRSTEQPSVVANRTTINYLSHEDFTYQITAANSTPAHLVITVRIFMAPEEFANEPTAWIEMDKFSQALPPGESTFKRKSRSSSVSRHPVWTAAMLEAQEPGPNDSGTTPGCRCGWPYTLLLPRGKPEGMTFHFVALFTSGSDLIPGPGGAENSASYCGLQDSKYPDGRAMGYPFDRPFNRPIRDWIYGSARPPQLASVTVNIKHVSRTV